MSIPIEQIAVWCYYFILVVAPLVILLSFRLPRSPSTKFFRGKLIGHRGCMIPELPENSLAALKYAIDAGADGVEFDVYVTKDGIPVIFHDSTLQQRIFNDKKGKISDMTLAEIKSACIFSNGESLPTLQEALELTQRQCMTTKGERVKLMIELKQWPKAVPISELTDAFHEYALFDVAVVGSFNPLLLYKVRSQEARIVTLLLTFHSAVTELAKMSTSLPTVIRKTAFIWDWLLCVSCLSWIPWFMGVGVLGPFDGLVSDAFIEKMQNKKDYAIYSWTVNDATRLQYLLSRGVAVATDSAFPHLPSPPQINHHSSEEIEN